MEQGSLVSTTYKGTDDKQVFDTMVRHLSEGTKCVEIHTRSEGLRLFSRVQTPDGPVWVAVQANPLDEGGDAYTEEEVRSWFDCEAGLWSEVLASGVFISYEDYPGATLYFMVDAATTRDLQLFGITGDCTESNYTYALCTLVKERMRQYGKIKLVYRTDDDQKVRKVFAFRSPAYCYAPLDRIMAVTGQKFPDAHFLHGSITHSLVESYYDFPGNAYDVAGKQYIPVIATYDSNTGDSSCQWRLCYCIDGKMWHTPARNYSVSRQHKGDINKALKDINKGLDALRDKFEALPKRMEELSNIEFFAGEWMDVLANLMEDNKAFQKHVKKPVRDAILVEANIYFNRTVHTAAEVVEYLMDTPSRISNCSAATAAYIADACAEFPWQKLRTAQGLL